MVLNRAQESNAGLSRRLPKTGEVHNSGTRASARESSVVSSRQTQIVSLILEG